MATLGELEHAFQNGCLSRRDFLTRVSALGMVATSGLLSVMPARADTPKKGGRLRLGVAGGSTSDSLDPATITDTMATNLSFGQLRNNLVEVNAKSEPIPELTRELGRLSRCGHLDLQTPQRGRISQRQNPGCRGRHRVV